MSQEEIIGLITKRLSGDISTDENQNLEELLEASEDHRTLYRKLEKFWEVSGNLEPSISINVADSWERFKSGIGHEPKEVKIIPLRTYWIRIAASLAILISVGYLIFLYLAPQIQFLETGIGSGPTKFNLPDNSVVWLNSSSQISFDDGFGIENRTLSFKGEGYFEVEKDPDLPFIVNSKFTTTKVTGTSFNLFDRQGQNKAELVLVSGKVEFSSKEDPSLKVYLEPGEKAILDKSRKEMGKFTNQNPNLLSWRENKLTFTATPLSQVLMTLEGFFQIKFEVQNRDILACNFTSNFENPKLIEILDVLSLTMDLKYSIQKDLIILSGEGCQKPTENQQ